MQAAALRACSGRTGVFTAEGHRLIAAGFGMGVGAAYAYVRVTAEVLAVRAPGPTAVLRASAAHCVLLDDGTLIECDRVGGSRAGHSGEQEHRRNGVNLQVVTAPDGTPVRISPALAGRAHDLTAARRHRIIATCVRLGIPLLAGKAHQGAGHRPQPPPGAGPGQDLTVEQRSVDRAHPDSAGRSREPPTRINTRNTLRETRSSPAKITPTARAGPTLEAHR